MNAPPIYSETAIPRDKRVALSGATHGSTVAMHKAATLRTVESPVPVLSPDSPMCHKRDHLR